ncbi:MAG: hypothetical protein FWH51_02265 [Dehalococcoidia bacterium]|nr:hypothetical protein [Dehalococcoidia bacterium]
MPEETACLGKKIASGPAEIIDYGTVISFAGNPISLHYSDLNINIIFDFKSDEQNRETYVDSSIAEPSTLRLTLYNFDDSFGAGTNKPMKIGKYEGRRLYLQLLVYSLKGSADKTLHYTIYRGEEVSNE